jgi:hypothetical protein
MAMLATAVETGQVHVVREASGRVVLICWGEDATGVAAQWASRGYQVYPVAREVLGI